MCLYNNFHQLKKILEIDFDIKPAKSTSEDK